MTNIRHGSDWIVTIPSQFSIDAIPSFPATKRGTHNGKQHTTGSFLLEVRRLLFVKDQQDDRDQKQRRDISDQVGTLG